MGRSEEVGMLKKRVIVKGDTLVRIAQEEGICVEAIFHLNNLTQLDFLRPGDVVILPVSKSQLVAPKLQFEEEKFSTPERTRRTLIRNAQELPQPAAVVVSLNVAVNVNVGHDTHVTTQSVAIITAGIVGVSLTSEDRGL